MDYNTIHKHLKQLKGSQNNNNGTPSNVLLDEVTAIKYVSYLRQDLISLIALTTDASKLNSKTLNEIIILTKSLDYVPKSDNLFHLFDAQLFRSLFTLACLPDIPIEVLRGILRISLTYLAGVLPKTRKQGMFRVLLNVLCEPIESKSSIDNNNINNHKIVRCDLLFSNLTSKITFADARMNLNIVDFVAKVLYRLMETIGSSNIESTNSLVVEEQWIVNVIRSLYVNNFFGVLSCIKGIGEIEGMTGLRGSMELTSKWLKNKYLDSSNILWLEYSLLTKEVGLNITNDISNSNKISLLSALSLIGVLKQPKRSLKKILVECNMTSLFPILKFLTDIDICISENKILDRLFGIWNTDLWFSLLNVSTRCWLLSGAKIENNDTDKIIKMIRVVITWLSNQLINNNIDGIDYKGTSNNNNNNNNNNNEIININKNIEIDDNTINNTNFSDIDVLSLLEKVDNFDYKEIKSLQLKQIRSKFSNQWSNEIKPFENLIHTQVIALVRDQRFAQLSKGSWVYTMNPLESENNHHYFLTLNSNSQSIVYKEFNKRPSRTIQTPNLDKDGTHIDFRNILKIESENLNPDINDNGLINIQSERMVVNKIEIITKTGTFTFYVDTKQLKDIWVDGLRILIADSKTTDQLNYNANSSNIINNTPMKLSISEEFFASSGVSNTVKKQVRTLEEIRVRTQMLDLDDSSDVNDKSIPVDLTSLSLNFHYD